MAAVICRDAHRHFNDVRAVDGVDLVDEEHEIFGLLGPNGSGKTTLLNQLQGLDAPTSGSVEVLGLGPIKDRVTPLQPRTFVAADLTVNFVLGLIGSILTLIVGILVFEVALPENVPLVIAALALGLVAMLALGYTLTSIYPSVAAATGIGNGLMILLIMISGVMIPTATLPETVQTVGQFSPITHLAELVRASWNGEPWPWLSVAVLVGMTVVFGVLSAVLFHWDPKR